MDIIQHIQITVETPSSIHRGDTMSNPPSGHQVQSTIEMPSHSEKPELEYI